jgi:hypothetical protein
VNPDEIRARIRAIAEEAAGLPQDENRLEALRALATERTQLEAQLAEAEILAQVTEPVAEPVAEGGDEDEADDAGEGEGGEDEAPAEEAAPEAAAPVALAASAAEPVDQDPAPSASAPEQTALIASGAGGAEPGTVLRGRDLERIHRHAIASKPGKGAISTIFASMNVANGPVLSEGNTAEQNTAIMASASRGSLINPITAAAGFCGPDDVVLDIMAAGNASRPVQDVFRTVPVRGPFKYMKTASLADVADGVAIWTATDQDDLDPGDSATWKPEVDLTCRSETTVTPYAVTAGTLMGVWQQLSAPEQIANWLEQLNKQYSKVAETKLLDEIRAQSHVFSAGAVGLGPWTTLQAALAHLENLVGEKNRGGFEGYTIIAPYGFVSALASDEGMKGFSANLRKQRILQILREDYGVNVVEAWEVDSTAQASYTSTLPGLGGAATALTLGTNTPGVYPLYIVNPDSYMAGSSDIVEAGYYRDGTLVRQNLVRYFEEGMEFLEHVSDHLSFVLELGVCPNGAAAPVGADIDCADAL